ncbi:MAG: hypothetical protein HN846_03800 [Candidatus Pacebacteria bacterium]|jgi:hypothetical protein|nr:hypothetical protein [Candidatus Paceibacterota bacterium]MBT4639919.1 hypothetical protein [Deltaproteobacteria bacterium]MBT3511990.1 hypothetical protein [Candidatus Paceibacterota bacterium]MBT4005312.1 hypothetical protein [Candidatus Paceibacterota bacterium]MBT4358376.1 hypothetical protein [Candidatus Paceibacterota bacterium]
METTFGPILFTAVAGVLLICAARWLNYWPLYFLGAVFLAIMGFMIQPNLSITVSSPVNPAYWAILFLAVIIAGLGVIFIKPGKKAR